MEKRIETKAVDPNLIGEWRRGNERIYFASDGFNFVGSVSVAFALENNGNTLTLSGTLYQRLAGDSNSIVGHWRNDPIGEEIYYRQDGRYISLWDDELLAFLGTYNVSQNQLTNLEYRARFETNANQILFYPFFSNPETVPYVINQNTLTLTTPQGDLIYTR